MTPDPSPSPQSSPPILTMIHTRWSQPGSRRPGTVVTALSCSLGRAQAKPHGIQILVLTSNLNSSSLSSLKLPIQPPPGRAANLITSPYLAIRVSALKIQSPSLDGSKGNPALWGECSGVVGNTSASAP